MKKLLILLAALALVTGFAAAEDLGITVGLEFSIDSVNDDGRVPYITAIGAYENAFFDGALDFYTELNFWMALKKDNSSVLPMGLWWDVALGYNFSFGKISNVSILLENELDIELPPDPNFSGIFTPGLYYTHDLKIGEVNCTLNFPFYYAKDDDLGIGFDIIWGWNSYFGLGMKLAGNHMIKPGFDFDSCDLTVSYSADSFYVGVKTTFPAGMKTNGFTIKPTFEYYFDAFVFYANCKFAGVGSVAGMTISPALGVLFSF